MFVQLDLDFTEVKKNLLAEAKLYGENEETTIIEFIDHIYKFGREFNGALKTLVLQERIRKQKQKRVDNLKSVKTLKVDIKSAQMPIKSSFKTLAQLNEEKKKEKRSSIHNKPKANFDKQDSNVENSKQRNRLMKFSKQDQSNKVPKYSSK